MKPQFITTPSGEELVVIPRAEYDALVARADAVVDGEDAADIAMYDARKAELASDTQPVLPAEVSALMLRGASLPAALRKWRGMSQQTVAARIGTAQGFISDLESGRRRAAANTAHALADVYDVPREWLMDSIGPRN